MATPQPFSLFPNTVPKIAVPNPHKRVPSLHRVDTLVRDASLPSNGDSVVIKLEDRPPVPQFPSQFQQGERRESTPSPEEIGRAVTTTSPIDGRTPTQTAPSSGGLKSDPTASSPEPGASLGTGSATTLVPGPVAGMSIAPIDKISPVVPIRSMFPTYNPSVPISQQKYVPQRPIAAHLSRWEPDRNSLSLPFAVAAQRSAPPSVLNFQVDAASINGSSPVSTPRELERLWEASHGAEPDASLKEFSLEMARTSEATFVFGSHASTPFYTLQTFDTAEIAIAKHNPRNSNPTDIFLCSLGSPNNPSTNNLVSFIFPKLAAILAIRQAAQLAAAHNLAPTDRDDVEAQAVQRAARQEACSLLFNPRGFYELEHPAIGRGWMRDEFATKSPVPGSPTATIRSITGKPVLHITIDSADRPLPLISIVNPNAPRIQSPPVSAGAGIRMSTFNNPATSPTDSALVSLDLATQILRIDTNAVLSLMPSLFAIDTLMAALFAVCVSDTAVNPVLGAMDIVKPTPRPQGAGSLRNGGRGGRPASVKSYAGSAFYATIAEREEAEEEARLMRREHDKDVQASKSKRSKPEGDGRNWFGRKKLSEDEVAERRAEKRKKKVVMGEFDLEKLGHYQSGERKGQELPVVVRGVVSGLVALLRFIVRLLTMIVQVFVFVLVKGTRCVTSERF